jgi:putative transposase
MNFSKPSGAVRGVAIFYNIFIELLWRSFKQEAVYLHELTDGFVAEPVICEWNTFYNTERPHTALDKRTPDIAYFTQQQTRKAA